MHPTSPAICVFCASSRACDPMYHDDARILGGLLARAGHDVVCGGAATGSMGALADGVLAAGGVVIGVLPRFMSDLEWKHPRLSELRVVGTMAQRKDVMRDISTAVVALPGGCGTFEELLETITLKRLGLFTHPIIIVNSNGFYDPLIAQFERSIGERFMDARHADMWTVVTSVHDVLPAIHSAPDWDESARGFAVC